MVWILWLFWGNILYFNKSSFMASLLEDAMALMLDRVPEGRQRRSRALAEKSAGCRPACFLPRVSICCLQNANCSSSLSHRHTVRINILKMCSSHGPHQGKKS